MVPFPAAVVEAGVSDASTMNTAAHADADAEASISQARAHVGATDPAAPIESASASHPTVSPIPRDVCVRVDASGMPHRSTEVAAERSAASAASTAGACAHVGAARLDATILCTQAKAALTGLGWKPAVARAAVEAAVAQGSEMTLEQLIFDSLRRCPVPRA